MKDYIRSFVQNINENYDILCAASQNVPKSELRSKQAKEFGWTTATLYSNVY